MNIKSKYIGVVLLCALIVACEAVAIEGALNIADLDLFLVSALPPIVGGLILMSFYPRGTVDFARGLERRGWALMLSMCVFVAAGIILWFDSVGKIGASKEAILGGGSTEVLFVVILSAIFLSERLTILESIGGLLIIVGVFLVLVNPDVMELTLGEGEIEAILSSLCLGISVVMTTVLLKVHALTPLSGWELFLSGLIIISFGLLTGDIVWPDGRGWLLLVLLGLFPAFGLLTYNAGLPKIGASLTSVLFALTGIMTVGVQLIVLQFYPEADIMLPQSVPLAVLGGVIAFVGVYLLNKRPHMESVGPAGAGAM